MIEIKETTLTPKDGKLRGRENCYGCNETPDKFWRIKTQRDENPTVTRLILCIHCLDELRETISKIIPF